MRAGRRWGGRSPGRRLAARAVFAGSLLVFLTLGIALVGEFSVQWWLLLLPVIVMVGPLLDIRRESGSGPEDGLETRTWR